MVKKHQKMEFLKNIMKAEKYLKSLLPVRTVDLIELNMQRAIFRLKLVSRKEDVIEASHNGIVAWEKRSVVKPILLQGANDNIKTNERWRILKQFFKENQIEFYEICSNKGSILSKLIYLIYLLDYATIYYSVLTKTDPSPVKPIDFIKDNIDKK